MRTLSRHILPICCTGVFILAAWVVLTLPIAAVFVIDNAFDLSKYIRFLFYALGASMGVSLLIMFPLSLLIERLVEHIKALAIAIPLFLLLVSAGWFFWRLWLTGKFLQTLSNSSGISFAFAVVFSFYWTVLWVVRGVYYGASKIKGRPSA